MLPIVPVSILWVIPNLMVDPYPRDGGGTFSVCYKLRDYAVAQEAFRREVRYGNGKRVYANPVDGVGFSDLYRLGGRDSSGEVLGLLDQQFAASGLSAEVGVVGYRFADITVDEAGEPLDHQRECALCAFPDAYRRSAVHTYILGGGQDGCRLYYKNNGGKPVTRWPYVEDDGWVLAEPRGWLPFWP